MESPKIGKIGDFDFDDIFNDISECNNLVTENNSDLTELAEGDLIHSIDKILNLVKIGDNFRNTIKKNTDYIKIFKINNEDSGVFNIQYSYADKKISFLVFFHNQTFNCEYFIFVDNHQETRVLINDFENFNYDKLFNNIEICYYLKLKLKIYNELFIGFVVMLFFYYDNFKNIFNNSNKLNSKMYQIKKIINNSINL